MSIVRANTWQTVAGITQQTILQARQAIRTDSFTSSVAESWQDIPGMSVTITPSSVNSRIIINFSLGKIAGLNNTTFRVTRNGGLFNVGDVDGSRQRAHAGQSNQGRDANHTGSLNFMYIDNPATTSAITYQLQFILEGQAAFGLNRTAAGTDGGQSYNSRTASTLIAMEVAG
jgi:hypothetical protein